MNQGTVVSRFRESDEIIRRLPTLNPPTLSALSPSQTNIHCVLRYTYRSDILPIMPMSLRLPADIEVRLAALSTLTGRSKTFYATEAIVEHLDDLEDAHLSSEVLARIRAGTEARIPLNDLLIEYGLAG